METENGSRRAYLHARPNSSQGELARAVSGMRAEHWQATPYSYKGKPYLEVRGFGSEKKLLEHLAAAKLTEDESKIEKSRENFTLWDQLRKQTLWLSGMAYLVGDYGFIKYGWKEKSPEDVAAGISYALGTWALLGYGRNDQADIQVHDYAKALESHIKQNNIAVSEDCALHHTAADQDRGTLGNLNNWARRYPSEIFNTFTGVAGAFMAAAALRHKVLAPSRPGADAKAVYRRQLEGWMDTGLGATTMTAAAIANFVQEKKFDPDEPRATDPIGWVKEKVQENPLAVAGGGYMISSLCHAASTVIAYLDARRTGDLERMASVPYRAMFVGAGLTAEALLAISSKGHGHGVVSDESVKDSVFAIAAELVAKTPKEKREEQIKYVAGFLEKPEVLAMSRVAVEAGLRRKVAELESNPWLCAGFGQTVDIPAPPLAAPAPRIPDFPGIGVTGAHVMGARMQGGPTFPATPQ